MFSSIIEKHYNKWVDDRKASDEDILIMKWNELSETERDLFKNISRKVADSIYASIITDLLKRKMIKDDSVCNANREIVSNIIVCVTEKFSHVVSEEDRAAEIDEMLRIYEILPNIIDSFRAVEKSREYDRASKIALAEIDEIMRVLFKE